MANRNILLIEPSYKNKYPPLGLMKLAQYHGPHGKRDNVRFIKGEDDRSVLKQAWDRIYVTTLFSFEFSRIAQSIDFALEIANGQADKVFVGGIAASLMPNEFRNVDRWHGIRFIKGLLSAPPAEALQLDEFSEELYSDDLSGPAIEDLIPDYSILKHIKYKYSVHDAYFAYASRGCIRKCSFCGVPKLEGPLRDTSSLSGIVRGIEDLYGAKKDLVLMDNNFVASPKFNELIDEIRDLGFVPGAKLNRHIPVQRRVDFNQGVDARILCKDKQFLKQLSRICINPLRIAFDHLGLKGPYEQSIRWANEFGLNELSNYMLYNFHDSPSDLFERMKLNVTLNEDLKIRIWSFPMRFQPTDRPDRTHVGEHWTRYQLRSMQIILQATHGVVSGAPDFFRRAFGDTGEEFESLLLRPHHFIFNREHYDYGGGEPELREYQSEMRHLSAADRKDLLELLKCDPRRIATLTSTNSRIKRVLPFYVPLAKEAELEIWQKRKAALGSLEAADQPTEEQRVEDAGLEEDIVTREDGAGARPRPKRRNDRKEAVVI
jgi:hypothetical protein